MSPYRDPSPCETSTGNPGEYALLESSIVLEASGTHELAFLSGPVTITTNSAAGSRSEYILLRSEDYCPTAQNGVTGGVTAAVRVCVKLFKLAGKAGVSTVVALANSDAAVPEDASSVGSGDGVEGTSEDSVPIQTATVTVAKEIRFNQALWALDSMSRSLFIKAYVDGVAEDAPEEVVAKVDSLFEDCGDGECHAGAKGDVLASSFILINVQNNLDGDGAGYLQMTRIDENNRGGSEVVHCGTGFPNYSIAA